MRYKRSPKQYFLRSSGLFLNSANKLHSGREWQEYQISALVERGRGQFLECVYTQHLSLYSDFCAKLLWGVYRNTDVVFIILSIFLCQTFWGYIKLDCCLWPCRALSGMREQLLECVYNPTFVIPS